MKIGFALPNIGPIATAEALSTIAQRAEALGYHSLWTIERLLYPVKPQSPYPATPDGSLPEEYKHSLDPLDALTFVASQTKKINLGTSVLDIPYYNPVMLARRLSTIDFLSNGRLRVGLGLGWSKDEMDATGADMKKRGAMADEFIQVLKAIWSTNPVEFRGNFYQIPKSYIYPKPVQKPHPPIYLAAFAPAALKRLATVADGWNPVLIPVAGMAQMFEGIKQMAKDAGRDPSTLVTIVRAIMQITDKPLGADRGIFSGTLDQIREDVSSCSKIGVSEVFFDPAFGPGGQSLERWLSLLDQMQGTMSA
jgi:probable F420-dependent oxidoreductase